MSRSLIAGLGDGKNTLGTDAAAYVSSGADAIIIHSRVRKRWRSRMEFLVG